jgi:tetratricopeptide (TPR) repeat protein
MVDIESESAEAMRLARKGARLDQNDPIALCMGGYAIAYIAHEFDDAVALMDRAIAVNPNHAYAWSFSAWLRIWRGEPDLAFEHVAHAMRLSPIDPAMFAMQGAMAYAHFLVGGYDEAALWAEKSTRERPNFLLSICSSAASSALAGQPELAHRAMARIRERDPNLRLSNLKDLMPFRRREDLAIFADGLRKAGLPD